MMGDQAAKLREMAHYAKTKETEISAEGGNNAIVYCITSGKGGVGKTSFAVNFAIALSRCNKKVVVIDADFGFSNVNILLGANSKYNISHVLDGKKRLDEIMEECFPNVWHISGGAGLMDLVHLEEEKLAFALEQLVLLDGFADYVLIDTGAGLNKGILRMISASDRTVLVMTSEPTSILDSYVMLKAISDLEKKPDVYALINKADSEKKAHATFDSFSTVVQKHLDCKVDMMGFMPSDERMSDSISSLEPYAIQYPTRLLSMRVQNMANEVTRYQGKEKRTKGFIDFFRQLLSKRGY